MDPTATVAEEFPDKALVYNYRAGAFGQLGRHEEAAEFDCSRTLLRHPRETKGLDYHVTTEAQACCEPGDCC